MLTKRVIPCLDVRDGRVVKGVNFVSLRDAGDPIDLAAAYDREGADEVVFLDITATSDNRATTIDMAAQAAAELAIPYTVGGGFRDLAGMRAMVAAGADKVSINSAAVRDPGLITQAATAFGSQAVVVAIDAKRTGVPGAPGADRWEVYLAGGRTPTGIDAVAWAEEAARRGAGEILLTSMDRDGTKEGFDLALTRAVARGAHPRHRIGRRGDTRAFRCGRTRRRGRCRTRRERLPLRHLFDTRGQGVHGLPGHPREIGLLMNIDDLHFDDRGLIACVVQQHDTGEVLMVAWMNRESVRLTLETGTTWFWSRSRQELWNKGATSGNTQRVLELRADCDADTLLALVDSPGPACHTGNRTCFFTTLA